MKVHEALAQAVRAEGCSTVFGLLGDANMAAWAALDREGLRLVAARHEAAAVAMADGHARATGAVGVATITSGPGLTQTGTSLVCAARNRTPLVVLTGAVPATDLDSVQRFDHRRFAQACEAGYLALSSAANAAREIAEAFYLARTRRRPVLLDLPTDVQAQELDWGFSYAPAPVPPAPALPAAEEIAALAEALLAAERPVLIAGLGARLGGAAPAAVRLADHIGALLATTLKAKALFIGHAFDLGLAGAFASAAAEELLAQADFVLGVGAELGYHTTEGGLLFPEAQVARIDHAPAPVRPGVLPGRYLRGDARATLQALLQAVEQRGSSVRPGFRTAAVAARLREAALHAPWPHQGDGMDPRALAAALGAALPADAVVTLGAGHFWSFFLMYGAVPSSAELHFSYAFGAIGQTVPLAAGVGAARAGRPQLVIEGDGSLMMHVQELETLVREAIPAVLLVWNDRGFGAEVHKLRAKGWKPELGSWPVSPDFVAAARAFGGDGARVDRIEELAPALARGFTAGRLFVIDARVSPSVVSDPYLKLQYGQENRAPLLRPAKGSA